MAVRPGLAGVLAPTHGHLGTVGFMLSMVMGVAFWMMPRPGGMRQTGYEAVTFALLQRAWRPAWSASRGGASPATPCRTRCSRSAAP